MGRLTNAERTHIIELYRQRRRQIDNRDADETPWRTFEYIAGQVRRTPQVIRNLLISQGLIDPPPPNISKAEMANIATDYRAGLSIRACAKKYERSYSTVRNALVYRRVPLRSRGGDHGHKDDS